MVREWVKWDYELRNFAQLETIVDRALAIAGEGKIACNQVLYHLEERSIEHEVLPWCERHGVAVVTDARREEAQPVAIERAEVSEERLAARLARIERLELHAHEDIRVARQAGEIDARGKVAHVDRVRPADGDCFLEVLVQRPLDEHARFPVRAAPHDGAVGERVAQRGDEPRCGQQRNVQRRNERHQAAALAGGLQHQRSRLGDAPLRGRDTRVAGEQLVARRGVETLRQEPAHERRIRACHSPGLGVGEDAAQGAPRFGLAAHAGPLSADGLELLGEALGVARGLGLRA